MSSRLPRADLFATPDYWNGELIVQTAINSMAVGGRRAALPDSWTNAQVKAGISYLTGCGTPHGRFSKDQLWTIADWLDCDLPDKQYDRTCDDLRQCIASRTATSHSDGQFTRDELESILRTCVDAHVAGHRDAAGGDDVSVQRGSSRWRQIARIALPGLTTIGLGMIVLNQISEAVTLSEPVAEVGAPPPLVPLVMAVLVSGLILAMMPYLPGKANGGRA